MRPVTAFSLFCLLILPEVARAAPFVLCGGDEVFIIDSASSESGSADKIWSWRAKDNPSLPEEMRTRFKTTSDCKPVAGGTQVLITASSGGCALVERSTGKVLWHGLASNAHTADLLPGNRIVVASSLGGDRLVLFDADKTNVRLWETALHSAHGVVWDAQRRGVCALGFKELRCYTLANWEQDKPSLVLEETYPLPDDDGHDLQSIPHSDDLILTTKDHVHLFDRCKKSFRLHPLLGDRSFVKGVDIHPETGCIGIAQARDEKHSWGTQVEFITPAGPLPLKRAIYKMRWLWP